MDLSRTPDKLLLLGRRVGPYSGLMTTSGEGRAVGALTASGIGFAVTRHGRVGSLAEAAAARGVQPRDIVKTMVVRRGEDLAAPGEGERAGLRALVAAKLGDTRLIDNLALD